MFKQRCAVLDPEGSICRSGMAGMELLGLQLRLLAACGVRSFLLSMPEEALERMRACLAGLVCAAGPVGIFSSIDAESAVLQAGHVLVLGGSTHAAAALRRANRLGRNIIYLDMY